METRGAKSGKLRRVPLVTLISGNDWTLIASATGQAKNPAWYYNLKKNPEAFLYHRGEAIPVIAREAVGQERDRIYASAIEFASNFAVYRDRTERTIPVMVLSRRTDVGYLSLQRGRPVPTGRPGRPRATALLSHGTKTFPEALAPPTPPIPP